MALSLDHQQWVSTMRQALSQDEKAYFKALGERITARRNELGLTQVQIAEALDVTQQTYASYEVGRRRIPVSLLSALARSLRTDINGLLGETARTHSKRGPSPKFQRHIERIGKLPKSQQRVVLQMLEGIFAQQTG